MYLSVAIISLRKRELVAFFNCVPAVMRLLFSVSLPRSGVGWSVCSFVVQ